MKDQNFSIRKVGKFLLLGKFYILHLKSDQNSVSHFLFLTANALTYPRLSLIFVKILAPTKI